MTRMIIKMNLFSLKFPLITRLDLDRFSLVLKMIKT